MQTNFFHHQSMNVRATASVVFFSLVAVLSFSVWAFGGSLFSSEATMYAGCAAVFLGLGGLALFPVAQVHEKGVGKLCAAFAVSYVCYALVWSLLWFSIPRTFGEVTGSALGLTLFAAIFRKLLGLRIHLLIATSILFLFHTVGYYTGGFAYESLQSRGAVPIHLPWSPDVIRLLARLSWGLFYGIGMGTGIVALLYLSRNNSDKPSTQI